MFLGLPPGKYTGTASAGKCITPNMNSTLKGKVLLNSPFNAKLYSKLQGLYWDFNFFLSFFFFNAIHFY